MIRNSDIQWWVLEANKHPESAPAIIEELAKRLVELDAENERLRNEIIRLRRRAPATRTSTRVETLERKVETLQSLLKRQEPSETSVVLLSDRLGAVRMPLSWAQELAHQGRPALDTRAILELCCTLRAGPSDELLMLTSQGRGFKRLLADVPPLGEEGSWPDTEGSELDSGERLTAAVSTSEPPRFWTVATRRGYVQRFVRVGLDRRVAQGESLLRSPFRNDEPVAITDGDRGDLLLVTRWGKAVRFSQWVIESQGSIALELDPDDEVVGALTVADDVEILIVTSSGYGARRDTAQLPARSRPGGSGKALIQAHDVLAVFPYASGDQLLYLTYDGKLILVPTGDIPPLERLGTGTRLHDLGHDPAVAVTLIE